MAWGAGGVKSLSDTLLDVLLAIALNQSDPADRDAMLAILLRDGWLPENEEAA